MPQVSTPTEWAQLIKDPTPPKEGQYGASHMVTVRFHVDSQEEKIWFDVGEFSNLRAGDEVVLEYVKNKWRISKTQPPELMQTLRARGPVTVPQASARPPLPPKAPSTNGHAPTSVTPTGRWDQDTRQRIAEDLQQRSRLIKACHDAIAAQFCNSEGHLLVSEETIQKYAVTLYLSLK